MELFIILIFIIGYLAIALEHKTSVNKAAAALLTGVLCWSIFILFDNDKMIIVEQLEKHLGEISQILFFLIGAMTIVEIIDTHDGFEIITNRIKTNNKVKLLWIISLLTFFLSAILDNLTTSIVMISMIRKLLPDKNERLTMAAVIIISANAGGAWSPIGDVSTTMLWIGGQITSANIIIKLIFPSLVCLFVPLIYYSFKMKGELNLKQLNVTKSKTFTTEFERRFVFFLGIGVLVFVPVFKTITHLPPYMGILFGLGLLWVATEIIHKNKNDEDKKKLSVVYTLRKIDIPTILFFLGILLSVAALQSAGQLIKLSDLLNDKIGNQNLIVLILGMLSAIIDNVPLVAAAMGMYDMNMFPTDHTMWEFLAYCAGTGGSILVIGSAAGVAVMGMENISFIWYLKKISFIALLGYFAGAVIYLIQIAIFN